MECETLRVELTELRIKRLELEQRDADRATLQAMDAAIRQREQQLQQAAAASNPISRAQALLGREDDAPGEQWWRRVPVYTCRPCGHVRGSVLRECCKVRACGCKDGSEWIDCCVEG